MVRSRPAWWLAVPGRFAGIERTAARCWLAGLALALLLAAVAVPVTPPFPEFLHDAIVAAMRHGGGFYDALHDLLRGEPDAGAAWLLPPALAATAAAIPEWAMLALVAAALTALLWIGGLRLGVLFARPAGVAMASALLAGGIAATAMLWTLAPHAAAAAVLSAIAIVARREDRWGAACATACAAAIIDPAALVTIAVMGLLALTEGARREARGWSVALLVAASVLAFHLWAVAGWTVVPAGEPPSVAAVPRLIAAALPGLPSTIAAPLVLLSVLGWATLTDALGPRVLALIVAGAALDGVAGLRSATLATALIAPGIALAPGAIGDLARKALDRRRITVTRIVR